MCFDFKVSIVKCIQGLLLQTLRVLRGEESSLYFLDMLVICLQHRIIIVKKREICSYDFEVKVKGSI